jgi:hypothetical protein
VVDNQDGPLRALDVALGKKARPTVRTGILAEQLPGDRRERPLIARMELRGPILDIESFVGGKP